jgi:hypothetical protein
MRRSYSIVALLTALITAATLMGARDGSARTRATLAARPVGPPAFGQAPFPDCPAYGVIGSRGSGDNPPGRDGGGGLGLPDYKFAVALGQLLPNVEFTYNAPPGYPAVTAFTAVVVPSTYNSSEAAGASQLSVMIQREAQVCPLTRLFLAGYSQGAQLTGDVAERITSISTNVAGVVLFADPLYNHNDPVDVNPRLTNDGILSDPRFGAHAPHSFSSGFSSRILSYCLPTDGVCQGLGIYLRNNARGTGIHGQYGCCTTWPSDAARYFAGLVSRPDQGDIPPLTQIQPNRLLLNGQPASHPLIAAQTFTAGLTGQLTDVMALVEACTVGSTGTICGGAPSSGTVRAQVMALTASGLPDPSRVLATVTKPGSAIHVISNNGGVSAASFSLFHFIGLRVQAGRSYAIGFSQLGPNSNNTTFQVLNAPDRYGRGSLYLGTQTLPFGPFTAYAPQTADLYFQTYVRP